MGCKDGPIRHGSAVRNDEWQSAGYPSGIERNEHPRQGRPGVLLELVSEEKQWEEQGFNRIAKVTARGARDFRRGVESRRSDEEEMLKRTQALYSEDDQLTEFLIRLYGHYRVVHEQKSAFVFDSTQDAQSF